MWNTITSGNPSLDAGKISDLLRFIYAVDSDGDHVCHQINSFVGALAATMFGLYCDKHYSFESTLVALQPFGCIMSQGIKEHPHFIGEDQGSIYLVDGEVKGSILPSENLTPFIILTPTITTGERSVAAVRAIINHGVPQREIVVFSLVSHIFGLTELNSTYPGIDIVTADMSRIVSDGIIMRQGSDGIVTKYIGSTEERCV